MTAVTNLPHADLAAEWAAARTPATVLHLDSAAAARSSTAMLDAVQTHLRREVATGGYVAAGEAGLALDQARVDLGGLVGRSAADVAFVESAQAALATLLSAWRLPAGATVLVSPGEYGPNLALFARLGFVAEPLAVLDNRGHVDIDGLRARLAVDPPAFVHLCHLGSHRGVVQPAAAVVSACRHAGVPVVVDAAQALGHVPCDHDADAVYATSRKWLAGPRGVGMLAVRPGFAAQLNRPVSELGSTEAFVAGRVGLGVALAEHRAAGPRRVQQRLAALGALTRTALHGVAGWHPVEEIAEPSATTTLAPPVGWTDAQVARAQYRLLHEHRVVLTLAEPWRAPLEAHASVLRLSPHVDAGPADIEQLAHALTAIS